MDALTDLLSSCNIDVVSDCEMVKMVEYLNRDIKLLVLNIMDSMKTSRPGLEPASNKWVHQESSRLHKLFFMSPNISDDSRTRIAESIFFDQIYTSIHKHFFEGRNFLGVGSDTLRDNSESLFSKLVACSALNLSLPALFLKIVLIYFYIYFIF